MNKPLYKFYDLKNLTQEDLNKLALERNTYKSIIDKIKEYCKEETIDNREYRDVSYIDALNNILKLLEEVE